MPQMEDDDFHYTGLMYRLIKNGTANKTQST